MPASLQGTKQKLASWWCYALQLWVCFFGQVHSNDVQRIATTLGGPMGHNSQLANQHRASPPSLEAHQS